MTLAAIVFTLVYLGMIAGRIPGLALDRTGIALLGALALVAGGDIDVPSAWDAVDTATLALLFGLMVVSAQFRLGGFYSAAVRRIGAAPLAPPLLLGVLLLALALLSALLTNDIVCFAAAPILVEVCARRRLDPRPFLFGLACAANIGSAATLIGNPQNILIGEAIDLPFAAYTLAALPSVVVSLFAAWAWLVWQYRGRWRCETAPTTSVPAAPAFNAWQSAKGVVILALLLAAFLSGAVPRDVAALAAAGVLLVSRRMHSREMLGLVDWQLLVLFAGLFVVNEVVATQGVLAGIFGALASTGIDLHQPAWLFAASAVLSNLVSNVPAVMLLLPFADTLRDGVLLALSSTYAGNLIVVGSIANIIVFEQARLAGVPLRWADHARTGIPVTLLSLLAAALLTW